MRTALISIALLSSAALFGCKKAETPPAPEATPPATTSPAPMTPDATASMPSASSPDSTASAASAP